MFTCMGVFFQGSSTWNLAESRGNYMRRAFAQGVSDHQNCVFFKIEQFLIVAACPGASCRVHRVVFATRGSPFFESFFGALFSLKIVIIDKKRFQNGVRMRSCGVYFLEKCKNEKVCFDCTGVCGLHVSPSHGAPRATPKSKKKHDIFQNLLF